MPELQWLVAAFPNFVRYVVVGFALAALFLWIYVLITPWREFALIRAGNSAAATALVGALLGFSLPLANTSLTVSLTDGVVARWRWRSSSSRLRLRCPTCAVIS
jgi:putative membrane protein